MRRLKSAIALAATASLVVGGSLVLPAAPASAQLAVFDAANYKQSVLQAARALERINQQVQSLQNEAAMLDAMSKNLERVGFPELEAAISAMERIDDLMGEADGIGYGVDRLDERVRTLFPGAAGEALGRDERVAQARARLDAARKGYAHAMAVQAQLAENVREDAGLLADLAARSQSAVGSLQVGQAANQLLALGIKQQLQLQDLMAAGFRGQDMERAGRAQAEADGRAATRRFLGQGRAYTPGSR